MLGTDRYRYMSGPVTMVSRPFPLVFLTLTGSTILLNPVIGSVSYYLIKFIVKKY
jgi:hypothetical protein